MKDGTRVTVRPGERFEAFCAEMAGEEHPLLDRIPQIGLEASPGVREMVEVFVAFRGDDEG